MVAPLVTIADNARNVTKHLHGGKYQGILLALIVKPAIVKPIITADNARSVTKHHLGRMRRGILLAQTAKLVIVDTQRSNAQIVTIQVAGMMNVVVVVVVVVVATMTTRQIKYILIITIFTVKKQVHRPATYTF